MIRVVQRDDDVASSVVGVIENDDDGNINIVVSSNRVYGGRGIRNSNGIGEVMAVKRHLLQ